jgi:site-specific DNA-methyltransferase (adenine-specific)
MSTQASFTLRGRNPDVLTCIANLSNDEVFTPPDFANRMLDTLAEAWAANNQGANIWADPTVTFLASCTKSGVFLRVINGRDPLHRAGILMIEGDQQRLDQMCQAGVQAQLRGAGIRIGIHFYNDEGDVERLVGALG